MAAPDRRTAPGAASSRPWTASVITVLVALEGAALLAVAVGLVVSLFSVHVLPIAGIIFATVVLAAGALWLGAAAHGTWRGLRWPRAAVLVSQAFLLIVGLSFLQLTMGFWGIVVAAIAVVTVLCLFAPRTVAWMHRTHDDVAR